MPFIRQNMFLIVLAGITLVLVAGLVVVNSGVAGDIDEQTKARQDVAAALGQLKTQTQAPRKDIVNQATITELKGHVQAVKDLSAKITKESEAWNKRYYLVYKFPVGDQADKLEPAFPLNEDILAKNTTSGIAKQYVTELNGLIAKLSPTWVPDEATIKASIKDAEDRIRGNMPVEGDAAAETIKHPVPVPPAGKAGDDTSAQATREGTSLAVVKMGDNSLVYVNKETPVQQVITRELQTPHSELWEAQLQLWVLGDIVAAIDQTNQQALSGQGGADIKRIAVSNAAIKQLVRLQVEPRYALGDATEAGSSYSGGMPAVGGGYGAPRVAGSGVETSIKGDQCLTRRVTTKDYDVKRYTITLVMATRYLKDFERYLMQRNYHTILAINIDKIESGTALGADISKFSFGSEPVAIVTISGELLLLSGWERALMPKDVLEEWVPKNLR